MERQLHIPKRFIKLLFWLNSVVISKKGFHKSSISASKSIFKIYLHCIDSYYHCLDLKNK